MRILKPSFLLLRWWLAVSFSFEIKSENQLQKRLLMWLYVGHVKVKARLFNLIVVDKRRIVLLQSFYAAQTYIELK